MIFTSSRLPCQRARDCSDRRDPCWSLRNPLCISSTHTAQEIVDTCLQFFGGYGYMLEYPVTRAFMDARVQRIYAGTNEIMKVIIAKQLGL
jgi:hypothetical protein